ncbi:MAG: hypothetical protein WC501_04560 [Candidatus Micrarchaeia archaeon]
MIENWKGILFILVFILFIITKNILFAASTLVLMIWLVASEVGTGAKKHGWRHEAIDTLISIIFILILWFGLQFILNTPAPVSGIVSCSMLPSLARGDMVVVQGSGINAYEIEMSAEEFDKINNYDSLIEYEENQFPVKGSIYSYCAQNKDPICNYFYYSPEKFVERKGGLVFHYSVCKMKYDDGKIINEPCVVSVEYSGKNYPINLSHDTIVYIPEKGTYFSYIGDIIHRAYFKINANGTEYYLAKGDNNPILDIQMYDYNYKIGNLPAKEIHGKQILGVPYLGYLKLFLSGFFEEYPQCKTNLIYDYVK